MKQKLFLMMAVLMAALTVSLSSCGDDNDEPTIDGNIVGYWKLVTRNYAPLQVGNNVYHMAISADGTAVHNWFEVYEKDGETIFVSPGFEELTWTRNGHSYIETDSNGEHYEFYVDELSDTKLSIISVDAGWNLQFERVDATTYETLLQNIFK